MNCKNCGNPLADGFKFCDKCGAAVEIAAEQPQNPEMTENQPVVEAAAPAEAQAQVDATAPATQEVPTTQPTEVKTKKKKGWKKPLIIVASILVVLGVLVGIFFDYISNYAKKLVMNPTEYYASIESDNIVSFLDNVKNNSVNLDNYKTESGITFEISEEAMSLLSLAGIDLESEDMLIRFGIKANKVGDKQQVTLNANINESEIVSGAFIFDIAANKIFGKIPLLSDKTFEFGADDFGASLTGTLTSGTITEETKNETIDLLKKYAKVLIKNCFVFEETSDKLTVNGVTAKYTLLTADVGYDDICKVIIPVLEELKDDDEAIDFIYDNIIPNDALGEMAISKDELKKDIESAIDEVKSELEKASSESLFIYKVWVDAKGNIMAREIKADGATFGKYSAVDGGKQGSKIVFEMQGTAIEFGGVAKRSGGVLKNGEYTLKLTEGSQNAEIIKIALDHFDVSKAADGQLDTKFDVGFGEYAIEMMGSEAAMLSQFTIGFDIESSANKAFFEIALNSSGNKLFAVSIDSEIGKGEAISIPEATVDLEEYEADIADVETILEEIIEKLEGTGLDKLFELVMIADSYENNTVIDDYYSDYYDDYDDYYDYYDDYDYEELEDYLDYYMSDYDSEYSSFYDYSEYF